jgi:hypothetical protein
MEDDMETLPEKTDAERRADKEAAIKFWRERMLHETVDRMNGLWWEAMPEEDKARWREYRQALLDISNQEGYPDTVVWPEVPK